MWFVRCVQARPLPRPLPLWGPSLRSGTTVLYRVQGQFPQSRRGHLPEGRPLPLEVSGFSPKALRVRCCDLIFWRNAQSSSLQGVPEAGSAARAFCAIDREEWEGNHARGTGQSEFQGHILLSAPALGPGKSLQVHFPLQAAVATSETRIHV